VILFSAYDYLKIFNIRSVCFWGIGPSKEREERVEEEKEQRRRKEKSLRK
jgi:hypothetical protein